MKCERFWGKCIFSFIIVCILTIIPAFDSFAMENHFTDVKPKDYFYTSVMWAVENGITSGTSETTFSPNNNCNRAQMVTFLWTVSGKPGHTILTSPFSDVKEKDYFYDAVLWAYENGVTSGVSKTMFGSSQTVTRAQAVTLMWKLEKAPVVSFAAFDDVASTSYYAKAVAWAASYGITSGTGDNRFSPDAPCKRGQIVTLLYRWKSLIMAKDHGAIPNDGNDDTEAINKAIEQAAAVEGGANVYLSAGTYVIDGVRGIQMRSNTGLMMDKDTVLQVKANSEDSYFVIHIENVDNVTVSGGKIEGEKNIHTGSSGEWGHGIGIIDGRNVKIQDMAIMSNWGDGIYLGTGVLDDELYGCDKISITGCSIMNNRRSNISIVDADNVTIANCYIANAQGTAPQCGINIEPNRNSAGIITEDCICKNIYVNNTTIDTVTKGNIMGQFFCFMTAAYGDTTTVTCDNLNINNCRLNGDCGNFSGRNCSITNTAILGTFYCERPTNLNGVTYMAIAYEEDPVTEKLNIPTEHGWY